MPLSHARHTNLSTRTTCIKKLKYNILLVKKTHCVILRTKGTGFLFQSKVKKARKERKGEGNESRKT